MNAIDWRRESQGSYSVFRGPFKAGDIIRRGPRDWVAIEHLGKQRTWHAANLKEALHYFASSASDDAP